MGASNYDISVSLRAIDDVSSVYATVAADLAAVFHIDDADSPLAEELKRGARTLLKAHVQDTRHQ
jgi:hypothetical protein